jgi:hypothetical protein
MYCMCKLGYIIHGCYNPYALPASLRANRIARQCAYHRLRGCPRWPFRRGRREPSGMRHLPSRGLRMISQTTLLYGGCHSLSIINPIDNMMYRAATKKATPHDGGWLEWKGATQPLPLHEGFWAESREG